MFRHCPRQFCYPDVALLLRVTSALTALGSKWQVSLPGALPPLLHCSRGTEITELLSSSNGHCGPLALTKLSSRVGGIESLLVHAPVEDVAVTMVRVIDLGEIPARTMHIKL